MKHLKSNCINDLYMVRLSPTACSLGWCSEDTLCPYSIEVVDLLRVIDGSSCRSGIEEISPVGRNDKGDLSFRTHVRNLLVEQKLLSLALERLSESLSECDRRSVGGIGDPASSGRDRRSTEITDLGYNCGVFLRFLFGNRSRVCGIPFLGSSVKH